MNRLAAALETSKLLPKSWNYPSQVDDSRLSERSKKILKKFEKLDETGKRLPASLMSERVHAFHFEYEKTVAELMEVLSDKGIEKNGGNQLLAFAIFNPYSGGYRILMKQTSFRAELLLQSPGYWPRDSNYPGDHQYSRDLNRSVRMQSAIEGGTLEVTVSSDAASRSSEEALGLLSSSEELPTMAELSIVKGSGDIEAEEPSTSGLKTFSRNGSTRKSDKRKREQLDSTLTTSAKKQKKREPLKVTTFFEKNSSSDGGSDFNDETFDHLVVVSSEEEKAPKKKVLPRPKVLSKIVRPYNKKRAEKKKSKK
ncbi:Oidioi.mRNA.OKI2018_I69.PAR.g10020.t1.cds [Oikopleura dioica]|uniref:Oidioi.mRNA.OKI2018_I69.PAR.g10020.t1.cds n=1 Tax=Oikopleura dioica TaxID=34765 RepID=A0ABN7RSV8_OIKDI|nr:Oidioi.mRNA.OKI2018_I69.PAR.g10020.t1.cds [Oikopleura dioica]